MPKKDSKILVPGCGNSSLSEKLALKLGMLDITSTDFEEDVIKKMVEKFPDTKVKYIV